MMPATPPPTAEQARVAVTEALEAVRALRESALSSLPERSRGRARIVAACDEALASTLAAIQGSSVGDDPRRLWQQALDRARRAVETAQRTISEVRRGVTERLARVWGVATDVAARTKRAVLDGLERAKENLKEKVRVAAVILGGLLAASATVMFSGWVILAAGIVLYYSMKGSD